MSRQLTANLDASSRSGEGAVRKTSSPMLALVGFAAAFLPIARHRPVSQPQLRGGLSSTTCCVPPENSDAALDEMIRREVEAAFKGMEVDFSGNDERELDELIAEKGDAVMRTVLSKLESDGEQLAAALEEQVAACANPNRHPNPNSYTRTPTHTPTPTPFHPEPCSSGQVAAYTREQQIEMLRKFDEDAGKLQTELQADRQLIRGDLTRLVSLQKELDTLQGEKGGFNRDSIVGGTTRSKRTPGSAPLAVPELGSYAVTVCVTVCACWLWAVHNSQGGGWGALPRVLELPPPQSPIPLP